MSNNHPFKTLTIVSLGTLPSYADFPRIIVDGTTSYKRPAVGTVINIENKSVIISETDANARSCAVTVTLSN